MNILVLLAIIILGVNASRFLVGAISLLVKKPDGVKMPWYMLALNMLEALIIVAGYVLLVVAYYK